MNDDAEHLRSENSEVLRQLLLKPGGLPYVDPGRVLEPQLTELLIYLAERPGQLIDKQELFEQVWNGKAITDETIWRAVADLRRALGDEARSPRFIETVHRRGYRFVGSMDELLEPRLADRPADAADNAEQGFIRRWLPAGRSRWIQIGGLLAIGCALIFFGSQLTPPHAEGSSERRAEIAAERDWHLLVKVDNMTDVAPLVAATETAVSVFLEQTSNVSVLRFGHIEEELKRMQLAPATQLDHATALDLCLREGLTGLLQITILPEAGGYRFIGEVTETTTREVVFSRTVGAESRETFVKALDRLGAELELFLSGSSPIPTLPLVKATTASLEALILYSRADEAIRVFDFDAADRLLEAALVNDPDFALARARQAIRQVNRNKSFDFDGLRELFAAENAHLTAFERAYLHAWWQTLSSRFEAVESWRSLTQRFPHHPRVWMNLAYTSYFWLADCEQAAAAIAQGEKIPGVRSEALAPRLAIGTSLCLGQEQKALEIAEALPADFIDRDLRIAQVLSTKGSHHQASARLREAAPELATKVLTTRSLGWIEVGRIGAAKELLIAGLQEPQTTPADRVRLLAYLTTLESLEPSETRCGRLGELVKSAGARDLRSPFLNDSPVIGRALAGVIAVRCGRLDTAADLLGQLTSPQALAREIPTEKAWTHLLEGEIRLAYGHHSEAATSFESALKKVDLISARLGLARTLAATGKGEAAVQELSKITRQSENHYRNPHLNAGALVLLDWHLAHYELGAVQGSLGRPQASRRAYLAFVEEWREMDADLPVYRAAAGRARLTREVAATESYSTISRSAARPLKRAKSADFPSGEIDRFGVSRLIQSAATPAISTTPDVVSIDLISVVRSRSSTK